KYSDLAREDLKVSTGVVDDPGQRSTRQQTLCWFWTMNLTENTGDQETNDYLDDFYRVHWLCTRAMRSHWAEELTLLLHEMEWVVAYFNKRASDWQLLASLSAISGLDGHKAYAMRQVRMWFMFSNRAQKEF
ncbi:hypothetical protein JAAARDRAFT_108826, partial [Jaapia argillacea MUCL 33604]